MVVMFGLYCYTWLFELCLHIKCFVFEGTNVETGHPSIRSFIPSSIILSLFPSLFPSLFFSPSFRSPFPAKEEMNVYPSSSPLFRSANAFCFKDFLEWDSFPSGRREKKRERKTCESEYFESSKKRGKEELLEDEEVRTVTHNNKMSFLENESRRIMIQSQNE